MEQFNVFSGLWDGVCILCYSNLPRTTAATSSAKAFIAKLLRYGEIIPRYLDDDELVDRSICQNCRHVITRAMASRWRLEGMEKGIRDPIHNTRKLELLNEDLKLSMDALIQAVQWPISGHPLTNTALQNDTEHGRDIDDGEELELLRFREVVVAEVVDLIQFHRRRLHMLQKQTISGSIMCHWYTKLSQKTASMQNDHTVRTLNEMEVTHTILEKSGPIAVPQIRSKAESTNGLDLIRSIYGCTDDDDDDMEQNVLQTPQVSLAITEGGQLETRVDTSPTETFMQQMNPIDDNLTRRDLYSSKTAETHDEGDSSKRNGFAEVAPPIKDMPQITNQETENLKCHPSVSPGVGGNDSARENVQESTLDPNVPGHSETKPLTMQLDRKMKATTYPVNEQKAEKVLERKPSSVTCHLRRKPSLIIPLPRCETRLVTPHITDNPVKPARCHACGKSFKKLCSLRRHITACHDLLYTLKCPHCHKTFGKQQYLRQHSKLHSTAKLYPCGYKCDSEFATKKQCQMHENRCLENKGRICGQCGKGFKTENFCTRHERMMHNYGAASKPSMKLYRCSQCNNYYKSQASLKRHMFWSMRNATHKTVKDEKNVDVDE